MRHPSIFRRRLVLLPLIALALGCDRADVVDDPKPASTAAVRLIDRFDAVTVTGTPAAASDIVVGEWHFDQPDAKVWSSVHVSGLGIENSRLSGRTVNADGVVGIHWGGVTDPQDELHEVEVRMAVSAGSSFWLRLVPGDTLPPLDHLAAQSRDLVWHIQSLTSPLVADGEMRTYTMRYPATITAAEMANLVIRPSDVADASFEIESVRITTRRGHLASIPSGIAWLGLGEIYRETLVARTPETLRFDLDLPARPQMHLALGTMADDAVTFRVIATVESGDEQVLLERRVETPLAWQEETIDLVRFAGQRITLRLETVADQSGNLALWGAPSIYNRRADENGGRSSVIFTVVDTLGAQYLDLYGYHRETGPTLTRLAQEGVHFSGAQAEATWTKPSVASMLTSLFPTTHGVLEFESRLPAAAATLAESFRDAGYATLSMSSVYFTGRFSNLHQGFETLHEAASLQVQPSSKTAEAYIERLLPWLDRHRDVPVFVFLHLYDPHYPYEKEPHAEKWVDAGMLAEHRRVHGEVRQFIDDPLMKAIGMPTTQQLRLAGADPDAFAQVWQGWYDGSVLGSDEQIARLIGHLESTGLDQSTLVAVGSDHGEEFLQHGRTYHGQGLYEELTHVPLIFWGDGVPRGVEIGAPVQNIDIMPTLLDLAGIERPASLQGRSLRPLIDHAVGGATGQAPRPLPVFSVKPAIQNLGPTPRRTEAFSVIFDGYKLIHNTVADEGTPEYELYAWPTDRAATTNLAEAQTDVVERLAGVLDSWREKVANERLDANADASEVDAEELERLRSLGYVQ